VPALAFDRHTTPEDVWIFAWSGAGGYGDPLEREPERVLADVAAGRVTAAWAEHVYGVVVSGGAVDEAATAARRRTIRAERLAEGKPWDGAREDDGVVPPDGPVSAYVRVEDGEYRCGGVSLGPATGNFKAGALVRDLPVQEANPNIRDPEIYTDRRVRFRQIICPETGTVIDTELPVDDTPPSWDVRPGR
jgi:N-methylhydantoinase B